VINTRVTNSPSASLDNASVAPSGPMPKDSSAPATCSLLRLQRGLVALLYKWATPAQNIRVAELIMAVDGVVCHLPPVL